MYVLYCLTYVKFSVGKGIKKILHRQFHVPDILLFTCYEKRRRFLHKISAYTHTQKEPLQIASLPMAASALSCKSTLWLATCCQTTWLPTFQVGLRDIFKAMWPKYYGEGNTVVTPSCMRPRPKEAVTCPAEQWGLLCGPVHLETCSALEKCLCLEFI